MFPWWSFDRDSADAQRSAPRPPGRSPGTDLGDSLVVTFAFHCNLACTFCMVEDVLDQPYPGMSLERLREMVERQDPALRDMRRLVLSGGEVTTTRKLPEYVAVARTLPGLEHVRIQTNAVRLADEKYARSLVDAGVDEFFVSIHGPDAAICDGITQKPGSFEQIVAGMRNVVRVGGTLITNTALVQANYRSLAQIVDLVAPIGPRSMEFWNFWPRLHEHARDFLVPVAELRPHVVEALSHAIASHVPPVVRWFPRCLLPAELRPYHDDGQPLLLIEEEFWDREPQYGCAYSAQCRAFDSKGCSGLSSAYVQQFGWEEELLAPFKGP